MKNILIVILVALTAVFGGLYFQGARKAATAQAELAAVKAQIAELQAAVAQKEQSTASLREKLEAAHMESALNAGAAAKATLELTNKLQSIASSDTNAKPANPFAEMFKDPDMRDMIKQQQKAALGSIIDKNYAALAKTLNLTPEQEASFKDLITKKMLSDADMGMKMMGGDLTAEQRAELMKQSKAEKDAVNEELKQFLGAENYATYETYEKSLAERMAVSTFKDQLQSGNALNSGQEQQLIDALTQEKSNFHFTTDYSDQSNFSGDFASYFSEDRMNTYFQEQEQLNQRYLDRAQSILTPAQYAAYQKSLKSQLDMARAAMKMAASMFGPKK